MDVAFKDLKIGDVILCSRTVEATHNSFFISKITDLSAGRIFFEVVDLASKNSLLTMSDATVPPSEYFTYGNPYRLNTVYIKGYIGTGTESIKRFNNYLEKLRKAKSLLESYKDLLENIGEIQNV